MSILINTPYSIRLGVIGAGTMGSGIALTALYANMFVTLYDVSPEMLERARAYIEHHLTRKGKQAALDHLTLAGELQALSGAGVVIEAIPEELSLKCELFSRLDALCPPPAILATNTSTLPVTAIAAAAAQPARVAGMHFFNPAPVMPLVEIVRGAQSDAGTIQTLISLAELLGKSPVVANDTPGFIVNRVARPFYGEALRLVGEGSAAPQQVDLLARLGGGFAMGPFQLMDLIGIDVNLAATRSMYEQSFGEPRYKPHSLQSRMVYQKALGRKTGRGFYRYDSDQTAAEPQLPVAARQKGNLWFTQGSWAPGMSEACRAAGYVVKNGMAALVNQPLVAVIRAGRSEGFEKMMVEMEGRLTPEIPILCQSCDVTLTEAATILRRPERLVGFDGLFFQNGRAVTLVASPTLTPQMRTKVETFMQGLGKLPVWVADSPALVLPRIVAMLANEAAFAVGEQVADMHTIDKAMQLGTNYPKGPLSWAKELGYSQIVAILDHLRHEYGEERYRCAPLLRRWQRLEQVTA